MSLCQPCCDQATIETRLDIVEEILQSERFYFSLVDSLGSFADLERLVGYLARLERRQPSLTTFQRDLNSVLSLRRILLALPRFVEVLRPFENELVCLIRSHFGDASVPEMLRKMEEIIEFDCVAATESQKASISMQARLFSFSFHQIRFLSHFTDLEGDKISFSLFLQHYFAVKVCRSASSFVFGSFKH